MPSISETTPTAAAGNDSAAPAIAPELFQVRATAPVVKAPALPSASRPGEIVAVQLQNNSDGTEDAGLITFGQVFGKGDLGGGSHLVGVVDGREIPVQMDVKATHADGSVRHAILTIAQPALAAGEVATVMLEAADHGPGGTAIRPADVLRSGYDVDINLTVRGASGTATRFKVDAAAELEKATAAGTLKTWMSGPLASEFRVVKPLDDHLAVTLDIRAFDDGTVRTDVTVGVESSYRPGLPTFYNYDVELLDQGRVAFEKDGIAHHRNSRWHKEVWSGDAPGVHVAQDVGYLKSSGAVVGIDTSLGVTAGSLGLPSTADTGPMGNATIMKKMTEVGGRGDLGIMPIWNARYLASQDERALETMLANADASGSIPWHYRDESTGEYLRIDDHPDLWMDGRTQWPQFGDDGLTNGFANGAAAGWEFDTAHQPALNYLPYLVTGSQYYLDGLMAQTAYSIASFAPHYRGQEEGFLDFDQVRGRAWTWRNMSDAAYATPDEHPLKAYFVKLLDSNLDSLVARHIVDGQGDKYGEFEGFLRHDMWPDGDLLVWQSDFVVLALGTMAQRGSEQAVKMLEWMDNFTSGRFINEENGFDPRFGSAYMFKVNAPGNGPAYDTWEELFQRSFGNAPADPPDGIQGWPSSPFAYAANARAAVSAIFTATQSADAMEAFGYLTKEMVKARGADGFHADPTWNVAPRLPDGDTLEFDQIRIARGPEDQILRGAEGNELIHGSAGDDTVTGEGGIDILFGGQGNDALSGGAGDDFLYGGAGDDRIAGGAGDDYLKGNGGADRFEFGSNAGGRDIVADFKRGSDLIEIEADLDGNGLTTAAQVLGAAEADGSGNAVLDLGNGLEVTVLGLAPDEMTAGMIRMI
ncbi:hypothetical protein JL101_029050 (plasmid) [Skermanella rosea]|uniref:calcium-binding protein n=1 Tax=Skermanella rosea TaxID=1817965 RepID=UPI001932DD6D|nr:calcium-binding protein [Skermanella rosea]UEM07052.1 hypothetical protein JL101_029050 [Skermanella rosea]